MQSASAKSHKVNLGGELFSDALGQADSPAGTYIGMVRHNVGVIVQALGGQVPPTWNPPSQHPPP
jgi:manganese/zinc/iron transport system substrate-binding protein